MDQDFQKIKDQLMRLNQIGIALSSERDLDTLLNMILREARRLTSADAGSLYIKEGDAVILMVTQNDTLAKRIADFDRENIFEGTAIPISRESLAGYTASTGKVLNIEDVYDLGEDSEYKFYKTFDEKYGYRCKSMLMIPMYNVQHQVIGVLQLINAQDENGKVVPFDRSHVEIVFSLASQAAVSIENTKLNQELKQAYLDAIQRLAVVAEFRDEDTAAHIRRMSSYSALIAQKLRFTREEVELMKCASPMHDIGKVGIRDAVLLKPGKLTPEEFEEMKQHTVIGAKILEGSDHPVFKLSHDIALTHHEKFNGAGYPQGLKGEKIPLAGRIVAVADVFDALTTKRCYKPAFTLDDALAIMKKDSGTHFDPEVIRAFLDTMDPVLEVYKREYLDLQPMEASSQSLTQQTPAPSA